MATSLAVSSSSPRAENTLTTCRRSTDRRCSARRRVATPATLARRSTRPPRPSTSPGPRPRSPSAPTSSSRSPTSSRRTWSGSPVSKLQTTARPCASVWRRTCRSSSTTFGAFSLPSAGGLKCSLASIAARAKRQRGPTLFWRALCRCRLSWLPAPALSLSPRRLCCPQWPHSRPH